MKGFGLEPRIKEDLWGEVLIIGRDRILVIPADVEGWKIGWFELRVGWDIEQGEVKKRYPVLLRSKEGERNKGKGWIIALEACRPFIKVAKGKADVLLVRKKPRKAKWEFLLKAEDSTVIFYQWGEDPSKKVWLHFGRGKDSVEVFFLRDELEGIPEEKNYLTIGREN